MKKKVYKAQEIRKFLRQLNLKFAVLHKRYEEYYWKIAMGQLEFSEKLEKALADKNTFISNVEHPKSIKAMLPFANDALKDKLKQWQRFFKLNGLPENVLPLRKEIARIESEIEKLRSDHETGYINPKTKKFIKATRNDMRAKMLVDDTAANRKAYFKGLQKGAKVGLKKYVELVQARNEFARAMGYTDFFEYKLKHEDNLDKEEVAGYFDEIFKATKGTFKKIRTLEKKKKNIRKPWNFHYMMSAGIKKDEDSYFSFERALKYWGRSLNDMGIGFGKGRLSLDLVDRSEKFSNPFCHWPDLVRYEGKRRIPGSARFTANFIPDTLGSGKHAMHVMFHEGGHAAHLLNSTETETCNNSEYLPMTSAWAETQSMFMDTMFNSPEWQARYAHNRKGEYYPDSLFEKKCIAQEHTYPLRMMSVLAVTEFERKVYEMKKPSPAKITNLAKRLAKKYFDYSEDTLWLLEVSHLYVFEWSCSYYGYGLAEMAVYQIRNHYYKKYGSIVANKDVGKDLTELWKLGARHNFKQFVKIATGKNLSTEYLIENYTRTPEERVSDANEKRDVINTLPRSKKKINLNGYITMTHGERKICSNVRDFASMTSRYHQWITTYKNT